MTTKDEGMAAVVKTAIQKWKDESLEDPKSALPYEVRLILEEGICLGYEAAITAERERIVAALEAERQSAEYGGTTYREITQNAFDVAIAIVKGGDER